MRDSLLGGLSCVSRKDLDSNKMAITSVPHEISQ